MVKKYESESSAPKPKPQAQPVVRPRKPAPHAPIIPTPRPAAARPQPSVSRPAPATAANKAVPKPASKPSARDRGSSPEAGPSRLPFPAQPAAPKPTAAPKAAPAIISSLFSANPVYERVTQVAPVLGAPSNAPIDTTSFAGLGLDPLLVHHLKNKMDIAAPTGIQKSALPFMLSAPLDINARREEDEDGNLLPVAEEGLQDIFIQSQTGSGKTLSFLLPIIQTLLPLSRLSYIDRSIGTLAIILAPTRELAQQISKVVESILSMALSLQDDEEDRGYTRWLVSGLLVGGSTRTHEKAKLRKGVPILVATPGRILDHLQNTQSFQCAKTLFLVLDEADRLMDLGFEESLQNIIKALDGRRRNEINAEREQDAAGGGMMRWPYWNRGRRTVLCSATIDAKVERLAGEALRNPVLFRSSDVVEAETAGKAKAKAAGDAAVADALNAATSIILPDAGEKFTPPSQLAQKYVVTPTKLRLVTLVSLLRSLVGSAAKIEVDSDSKEGTKVMVFLSSTDAVDYHFKLLGGVSMGQPAAEDSSDSDSDSDEEGKESADEDDDAEKKKRQEQRKKEKKKAKAKAAADLITLTSPLFPNTAIQRLHGSLPLRTRQASLKAFGTPSAGASILLCTSVASRGLDLPLVKAVVQYDLPTEGGAAEYVHRVGRTARAGKGGEAWALVSPSESEWVPWVEGKMCSASSAENDNEGGSVRLQQVGVDEVLRKGMGGRGNQFEARATEVQLAFEQWVLADEANVVAARRAFASWVRAYSTHPLEERRFFAVKALHLGHLAKAFALREAPGAIAAPKSKSKKDDKAGAGGKRKRGGDYGGDSDDSDDGKPKGKEATARNETERRMYEAVRKQGRLHKSGGALGAYSGKQSASANASARTGGGGGGGEFQVMDTSALERMATGQR